MNNQFWIAAIVAVWLTGVSVQAQAPHDTSQTKLTMNFKDADILNVLRLLSRQNNLNLVASKEVKGRVTVHFNEVSLDDALETILKANGYDYYIEKDIIFVKPIDMERNASMASKVFELKYVDANDMKDALTPFLSKQGKMETLSRTKTGVTEEKRSSLLIVSDLQHNVVMMDSIIRRIDIMVQQLMIEVRMYETTLGDDQKVGVGLPTAITGKTFDARNPDDPTTPTTFTAIAPLEDKLQNLIMGKLSVDRLLFSLNFLKTQTNSKLLSNPKLVTMDNQKAEISVGTAIPVQTISRNASGDIITFTDKNVNVTLKVTPKINPDSMITLLIEPIIEDIIGYVGNDENRQPIISRRTAKTQVMIKNNESIVLGGLLKENEVDTKEKVWLLGDIPLLGKLFTSNTKEKKKTDLLIFITPHILDQPI
ncbi:secretin and TonB N-terminal domain-containing protein [bacterium]|nr:secretin and TonB N-terminal domain-containing protein [bacterium]